MEIQGLVLLAVDAGTKDQDWKVWSLFGEKPGIALQGVRIQYVQGAFEFGSHSTEDSMVRASTKDSQSWFDQTSGAAGPEVEKCLASMAFGLGFADQAMAQA